MSMTEKKAFHVKESLRQLSPAYILIVVFCFMLFIYEPILMYCTNKNDFWFDFGIMIFPTLLIFAGFTAAGFLFVTICWVLLNVCLSAQKAEQIYQYIVIAFFVVFLATYVQGNFLAVSLPVLTGEPISWDQYLKEDLITIGMWLVLEILAVIAVVKLQAGLAMKWAGRIALLILLMLVVGLTVQVISNDALKDKDAILVTNEHFNEVSSGTNFIIFLADAVNSTEFEKLLDDNEEYRDVFEDFTYYTDTASVYPYTRDSMPLILTGEVNRNEKSFEDYSSDAYNHSPLFERLLEENFNISIFMDELVWYGNHRFAVANDIKNSAMSPYRNMHLNMYFRQEMKYILFKYLPYAYKQYSQIEGLDFGMALDQYNYHNEMVYENIVNCPELTKTDQNVFQFVHIEGAHLPFKVDKDLNEIENGTYSQKIEATIKMTDTYLTRLKNNDAYHNSIIIIMADHGYYDVDHDSFGEEVLERYHPILLIKGLQEKHVLKKSDIPISHLDLMEAYMALLDGKKSGEVFDGIDQSSDRKRTVIWQEYRREEHMVEYELEGSPDDRQNFKPTGKVYDR